MSACAQNMHGPNIMQYSKLCLLKSNPLGVKKKVKLENMTYVGP